MMTKNRVQLVAWLRRNLGTVLVLAALLGLLGLSVRFAITAWNSTDAVMDIHGWIAMVLGVFFSCLVGFGLMVNVLSSRKGYDEPPTYTQENEENQSDAE